MGIFWNGDVVACYRDINGLQLMGNVTTASIKDIWFGERFNSLRQACQKNQFPQGSVCRDCTIWKPKYIRSSRHVNGVVEETDGETLTVTYRNSVC
jgi:hypothetical protein